ncbi:MULTISPECIES: hypothetical protein [Burkholderia]|uniref:Uncharacterized protein n=2 Tax=Burkholderia humptydooensis TaxID=430531 RepID=A0A7U4PCL5_9BURK|nr:MULTISPECIES: hypothetical protein [Burkholderia]AGK50521.1 hypothetical protein BTI_4068 [Burkholderia thailandensis MSMB121]ATF32354.1 hypothetical protein CO709_02260 [Burkholderia thailandensis]AJY38855.1 hypothetical protein BW21_6076 [Burkholderia sp. 2002721687]ALX46949.1 hypothetical protein AQ610_22835 [Burkholderia humptydooensis]KST72415.1 hypothetical protein WS76_28545 [Burkholderia humptydooensis]
MERGDGHRRRRRLARWIHAVGLSALFAIGITWIGAAVDHPVEQAIVDGMAAPECARVRAMPAGSLLSAQQPDSAVCRSFFLYRAAYVDAASNPDGYSAAVMRARVDEFWQLVGYVLALWFVFVCVVVGIVLVVRRLFEQHTRHHKSTPT